MGYLRAYYERMTALTEEEWQRIASCFVCRKFAKGEVLVQQGATEHFMSFIETGTVRYFLPDEEPELTFNFSFDREFACAYDSFLTQTPSEYQVQAMTDTVVWSISYNALQRVYAETQTGNYLGRMAAEQLLLAKSRRELSLLRYTAKERYLRLFREHNRIIREIPLKYIASYIGITPQALSRIRREIC